MNDTRIELVATAYIGFAVDSHTLFILPKIPDIALVTFFLKVGGLDRANRGGLGKDEGQRED